MASVRGKICQDRPPVYLDGMPKIASWIRKKDEDYFNGFLKPHPEIEFANARLSPPDLDECAGLLVTGGPDVSEKFLRQEIPDSSLIKDAEPARDEWEFAAVRKALECGKPVFAVCKGAQVLNVALGGTLFLDIPGHDSPEMKMRNIQPLRHSASAAHRLPLVNSSHHQALDKLGDGLEVEAWCATDGVVEQVRLARYPFCLGVQYHPERHPVYTPLFEDFFSRLQLQ